MRSILLLFTLLIITHQSLDCHYTCQNCSTKVYAACTVCPETQSFSYKITSSPTQQGVCGSITTNNVNVVGIIAFLVVAFGAAVIFNEEIIYLALFLQSLGLLYLVEVYWLPALDYCLSGLTYLMIFSKMTFKSKSEDNEAHLEVCKGRIFFKQFELAQNLATVGLANAILLGMGLAIVIFKNCRKRCKRERVVCFPDWLLDKLVLAFSTAFLFLIQESTAVIYFSLKYSSQTSKDFHLVVLYFIGLFFFTLNHCLYPLPFFRNKVVQANVILIKTFSPLFLIFSTQLHFIVFVILLIGLAVDLVAAHKNSSNKRPNRFLLYKIVSILVFCLLIIYYCLEIILTKYQLSKGFGIVCMAALAGQFSMFGMEIFFYAQIKNSQDNTAQRPAPSPQIKEETMQNIAVDDIQTFHKTKMRQQFNINFEEVKAEVYEAEERRSDVVPDIGSRQLPSNLSLQQVSIRRQKSGKNYEHFEPNCSGFIASTEKQEPSGVVYKQDPIKLENSEIQKGQEDRLQFSAVKMTQKKSVQRRSPNKAHRKSSRRQAKQFL